ncbi:MAG: succinylglutamate desuccinylase/aspartoacylase family protein [Alphaproteobacteria bacterium]
MSAWTRAWTRIDFEKDGRQVGSFNVGHSVHRSAYGVVPVPVAVLRNGDGPTVLLMAGNHGDEYEGQVVLAKLIRTLDPARLRGRLIVVPCANAPAARAGTRTSPIDGGNLNREFPGDASGTLTEQIAHYIASVLMPMSEVFADLHSGGSSLDYLPYALAHVEGTGEPARRAVAAMLAMGYPLGVVWQGVAPTGTAGDTALPKGLLTLGGEFGGRGFVDPACVRLLERGVNNLLAHLGVLDGKVEPPATPTRLITSKGTDSFLYADMTGLFEPAHPLGTTVGAGDVVGWVHVPDDPLREPVPQTTTGAGMILARRAMGRVEPGDCLIELAQDDPTRWL